MFGVKQVSTAEAVLKNVTTTDFFISNELFLFIEDTADRTFRASNGFSIVTGGYRTCGNHQYSSCYSHERKTLYLAEQDFQNKRVIFEKMDFPGCSRVPQFIKDIGQALREAADLYRKIEAEDLAAESFEIPNDF